MNAPRQPAPAGDPWLYEIFQNSPDTLLLISPDGTLRDANQAFLTFCGRPASAVRGAPIADFIPAEHRAQWTHDLAKLLSGEWTRLDATLFNANGRLVPFHIALIGHSRCEDRPVVILHCQDASVYQTVERALVASQGQWDRSFDAIADGLCVLDRTGVILRANQAMLRRFQPLRGNLVGRDYRVLFGGVAEPETAGLPHAVTDSPFVLNDIRLPTLPGWFSLSSYPLKDLSDTTTGAVLILRDLTEQHQTAEALKKAEAVQHQATKMQAIGRLAGGIAHDFNNMLTSILGYGSLTLKMTPPDDPRRKDIQEIIAAAERATALTRHLLDFSRNQAVETKPVNLSAVVQHMEQFLARTLGETIALTLRLAPGPASIKADVSRLEQVLINLSVNARDAMPRGGQLVIETGLQKIDEVYCALHPDLAPGRYVMLQITDTGHGMPPEVLDRLFEPFFTTKPRGKGTGLGLMTTYGIVKQFGGHISVYSEVDRGTTFKLLFPESTEPADAGAAPAGDETLLRGTETILVVDDERNIVAMVSQILGELGYRILPAHSGREALALCDQAAIPIDLVLSDIIMPDLNGTELVRRLRQRRPGLKALFMSGYATSAAVRLGVLKPDTAFLQKPFTSETLTHCIRKVLDVGAREPAAPGGRAP